MSTTVMIFVSEFKYVVQSLGDSQLFTPHYAIHRGMIEASREDCSNDGKYCMFSLLGVPGRQLLSETLTQICVWEAGKVINDSLLW